MLEISHSGEPGGADILVNLFENTKTSTEKRALAGCLLVAEDLATALSAVEKSSLPKEYKSELAELLVDVSKYGINPPKQRDP